MAGYWWIVGRCADSRKNFLRLPAKVRGWKNVSICLFWCLRFGERIEHLRPARLGAARVIGPLGVQLVRQRELAPGIRGPDFDGNHTFVR